MNSIHNIKPVRKSQTVYGSVSGHYAFRNEKIIWHESTLERDFLRRAEFNDSVLDVISQPVEIPYTTKTGKETTYTPDFLVTFSSDRFYHPECVPSPILAEIKPNAKLQKEWDFLKVKFKAGLAYAKQQGWIFHIYDENRIRDQYLTNINFLRRFHKGQYSPEILDELERTLKAIGHCRINELPAHIFNSESNVLMGISHTWHLIATKRIACEMQQPLSNNTLIWINDSTAKYYGDL